MQAAECEGSIICTASVAAIRADVTPLEYAASKGAVIAMVCARPYPTSSDPTEPARCDLVLTASWGLGCG